MRKSTTIVTMLVLLTLLAAPMVLAQEEESCPELPGVPCIIEPYSGLPMPLYTVDCQRVYNDPMASCTVDENGLITMPDGSKAPYSMTGAPINGPGGLYEFVDGEFVVADVATEAYGARLR